MLEVVGERGLADLAAHRALRAEHRVLDVLLGDRRPALEHPALGRVLVGGAQRGAQVHALVLPEPLVLDRDDGVAKHLRDLRQRDRLAGDWEVVYRLGSLPAPELVLLLHAHTVLSPSRLPPQRYSHS